MQTEGGGPAMDTAPGKAGGNDGFGARLRRLRERRGLSNAEVVERTGLSRNTVTNAERDRHPPVLRTLKLLADAYSMDLSRIIDPNDDLTTD